jgi:glyoxylase-like metal-dependent hydrolase (beta-lactamase superfamily II)
VPSILASTSVPRSLAAVDDDAEVLGLRLVATPGHTPGHISVYDPGTGLLVAGDALGNTDGLTGSNPQFTADQAAAEESVRRLAALDVRRILFGHGDPLEQDAATALRDLAASL